ncbi:MAG: thioredoxin domain-containing protein [Rhodococcus sp.]|uniref:thioredoxin domain-containing protein n=1 Tax=Rhodococcoides fascians TaxID=1828 RepID=UPI00050BE0C1|nr:MULTISPECIES: thioredoxin domain-containing protein [Rhodococcus]MCX6490033.1 thioredoxin domain-containing protein [Rhodococcus sp. (in: high G+C Gram-positive bacteria)]WQH29674.1 thioredoxin domain-containing protein [Rhodococcus fascians]
MLDANTLGESTSPYLRQHADNPVHWQQWGLQALQSARDRDVPILLSIGYSACHWCHVMAHESFEDEATAALMNEHFVCIKVDREERPDLDAVYMNATVAMTGQGGWPMTCFLTPETEPFYCGTYYPPAPRQGMPSFEQLLTAIADTWSTRRQEVFDASAAIVTELRKQSSGIPAGGRPIDADFLAASVAAVCADEDTTYGGFGRAPKFPPGALLEGLLRHYERTGNGEVLEIVRRTAAAMARGGMYDQLAGGFARYSVDAEWIVPHFEKMLYDNALLLRFYAHAARVDDDRLVRRVASDTARFMLGELRTANGCFASALDADTEGVEGLTYVWTPEQLVDTLGFEDGVWAAGLFAVNSAGTFEAGMSVLQLPAEPEDYDRFARIRNALSAARASRPQPGRDDKVVTAWNALAITALAEAGTGANEPTWVDAAVECGEQLFATHVESGRVRRASLGSAVGEATGVLEDYACLAVAAATLFQATGDAVWTRRMTTILDAAIEHFADPDDAGSWFDTADDAETLVTRLRDPIDGATPSGASTMAEALLTAAALVDHESSARYAELAAASLARAAAILERAPRSGGHWLAVAEASVRGPIQIAVSLAPGGELLAAARSLAPGGSVVVAGSADSSALLTGRPPVDGQETAYVCRGFVCDRPVTSVEDLAAALRK